jgi:aspartate aminotransferase
MSALEFVSGVESRHMPVPEFGSGVGELENEGAYAVMAAASALEAATGRNVVHLEIGQPGFATPSHVAAAGIEAIAGGDTKYTAPGGKQVLRERIAERTTARMNGSGVTVSSDMVVVGPGAKPGLFFTTLALVRGKEDEVIIPDPGFPTYAAMVGVAGGTCVPVRMDKAHGQRSFDMSALEKAVGPKTRLLIINSPSNPVGGIIGRGDLERIADLAKKHDFWVLSDEIYSRLTYGDNDFVSMLSIESMAERTIVVDGFSKSWAMTGWRLGWAVMPAALAERVELLLCHSVGCTSAFVQTAGIAALSLEANNGRDPGIAEMRKVYRRRRDLVVNRLNAMTGVICELPDGAFYAWADVSAFGLPSRIVAERVLQDGFVAVLPGTDFGEFGEGFIRISYVSEDCVLEEGMDRLEAVLGSMSLAGADRDDKDVAVL